MRDRDWLFTSEEYICDLRTVAVLVKNGKILVQRERDGNEYALPGGHVKIGETLEDGLIRETLEEMGVIQMCDCLYFQRLSNSVVSVFLMKFPVELLVSVTFTIIFTSITNNNSAIVFEKSVSLF